MAQPKYPSLFKTLTPAEDAAFRDYARTNDPPDVDKWEVYHPVCREEWTKRGIGPDVERCPGCLDIVHCTDCWYGLNS